jgi:ATP-dependent protease HslVU (ClpYQ) ATPase subunit
MRSAALSEQDVRPHGWSVQDPAGNGSRSRGLHIDDATDAIADLASEINGSVENIGARRLQTVIEKLLEEVSFTASEKSSSEFTVDARYLNERVAPLAKNADLSKFVL